MPGARGPTRRITSTPPPPGRCTSSSTTSGSVLQHRGDRGVDVLGLGDARRRGRPARPAPRARNIAWSSTITTVLSRRRPVPGWPGPGPLLASGGHRHAQPDLGALAGRGPDLGGAAVPLHPGHDAVPDAEPVVGDVVRVEAAAAVAHEDLDVAGRCTSA